MTKGRVEFYTAACKSCLYCAEVCPNKVLGTGSEVNAKGYNYMQALHPEKCIGCGLCARICPDAVISVYREVV